MNSSETKELLAVMHQVKRFMHDFHSNQNDSLPQMAFFTLLMIQEKAIETTIDDQVYLVTRIAELCHKIEVSKPAISRTLNDLEDKGYIKRIHSHTDRRNVYVYLTPNGENLLHQQVEIMEKRANLFSLKLGNEDRTHFIRILKRIPTIMQEVMNETTLKGDQNE